MPLLDFLLGAFLDVLDCELRIKLSEQDSAEEMDCTLEPAFPVFFWEARCDGLALDSSWRRPSGLGETIPGRLGVVQRRLDCLTLVG